MNNDIVIDTTAPYVIAVMSLREGVYTMGQTVDLQVNNAQPAQRVSEEQRLAAHQLCRTNVRCWRISSVGNWEG